MNFIPSRHQHSGALTEVQQEHYEIARSFAGAFEAKEFRERYLERYPARAPGSILPSDFAYNNEQVAKGRFPWFLERVERGVYRFVGMIQQEPANTLYEACRRLEFPELDRAFFYKSIPLAVCDAVFSIGTRYEAVTRPIVARYAQFIGSPLYRDNPGPVISPRKALEMSRDYTPVISRKKY